MANIMTKPYGGAILETIAAFQDKKLLLEER